MAEAGRKPKIGGEKARSGRALIHFDALNPAKGTPPPPRQLDQHGVECWVQACRSLVPARLVSHADLLALEMMAVNFSRWRRAEEACRRGGRGLGTYAKTPSGYRQISANRVEANKAQAQFLAIAREFGLTPVARIKTTESAQGDLPFDEPAPKAKDDDGSDDNVHSIFSARPARGPAGS